MLPQTLSVSSARKFHALGASIATLLLLTATLVAAAQVRAADRADETLHDAAMAQPDPAATSTPEQHTQSRNFFFGWVQFDVDPDAPGGVPGFDFADPSAPHGALAAAQPDTER